jgi:hypothetical protein
LDLKFLFERAAKLQELQIHHTSDALTVDSTNLARLSIFSGCIRARVTLR